ncbi:MAG: DUF1446 domain-containing protein [Candidatus Hydrogenedentes bacterium]|nr:DUF1446 domain-containing protein [Candidatus Hydrogenedentota bacterium]
MENKIIRIGCASGFWGDSNMAAPQLLASKQLDYLVFDYLAEITMSILARARAQNPEEGYALDFVSVTMRHNLAEIAKQGVKVVSNAGGVNPLACARAIEALVKEMGLNLKVAAVTGDDLLPQADALRAADTREMFSNEAMPAAFMSVNAYLGAFPIAQALSEGADIVITGRCVDSAVTLGPCIHEFGWTRADYHQLAGGSLAGHIIECGAQATGGLFTDWDQVEGWENIGYPIVEVDVKGEFVLTKPENTGGLVNRFTAAEQLVYEIGDPRAYILPDAVCDFSEVRIEDISKDRVRIHGARGSQPTNSLKVSATCRDGYRIGAYVSIRGRDAGPKAQKVANAAVRRSSGMFKRIGLPAFKEVSIEVLGVESGYGPHAKTADSREVVLKIAAKHDLAEALMLFLRELTSSGTSMAPGISGMGGNRPKPSPVIRLFSFLVPRDSVTPQVTLRDQVTDVPFAPGASFSMQATVMSRNEKPKEDAELVEVPLIQIACGRSGDKGAHANVGIVARKPAFYPVLKQVLTANTVKAHLAHVVKGEVRRFELPGIQALNFELLDSLEGGGMASLLNDPQGKAYAQILLDMPVFVPRDLL